MSNVFRAIWTVLIYICLVLSVLGIMYVAMKAGEVASERIHRDTAAQTQRSSIDAACVPGDWRERAKCYDS